MGNPVVVGCFVSTVCCAVILLLAVLLRTIIVTAVVRGGSVRGCVHGFVGFFLLYFFFPLQQ